MAKINECDYQKIIDLYVKEKKTLIEVAKIFDVSYSTIAYALEKKDIQRRSISESQIGKKLSKEHKESISKTLKNRIFTKEHREKLSIAGKKRIWSKKELDRLKKRGKSLGGKTYEEIHGKEKAKKIKEKLSKANSGRNNCMFGRKHSDKAKLKISLANKGRKNNQIYNYTGKKISCLRCGKKRYIEKSIIKNSVHGRFFCSPNCKGKYFKDNKLSYLIEYRKYHVMPKKDTKIEVKMQNLLKELGIKFITHRYMKEIKHAYQCDIFIRSMKLVIECDGVYWHNYPLGNELDIIRTQELFDAGFRVLRFWGSEVKVITKEELLNKINQVTIS